MNWMLSCCCCTSAFGIYAMMIMDHHGTENGILFFFRPSHSSPYEKEIQHFHSNHQSVSSWFTDQKPNKVLLNTNIEKYRFSQHAAPTDSSMTPAGQAAQKQGCGGLYLWGSLPLFLLSWKHYQNIHPSLLPHLLALNPKAAPPEHSHHLKHVQGPAKPLPWTQGKCLSATSQLCWYHRQKGESLLIPTWLKLMLPLNTTQRYYYPTESSRKEKIPSALFCQSLQKSVILFNTFCPLYLWKLLKLEQVPK